MGLMSKEIKDAHKMKELILEELAEHGMGHTALELEAEDEHSYEKTATSPSLLKPKSPAQQGFFIRIMR